MGEEVRQYLSLCRRLTRLTWPKMLPFAECAPAWSPDVFLGRVGKMREELAGFLLGQRGPPTVHVLIRKGNKRMHVTSHDMYGAQLNTLWRWLLVGRTWLHGFATCVHQDCLASRMDAHASARPSLMAEGQLVKPQVQLSASVVRSTHNQLVDSTTSFGKDQNGTGQTGKRHENLGFGQKFH